MKNKSIIYTQSDIEKTFQKLLTNWEELTQFYDAEVRQVDESPEDRLVYIDMGEIARFVVDKTLANQTKPFSVFFENVEEILVHGDAFVKNLVVVGLFEGIQNRGGKEIDYYRGFDKWLKNESLKAWRDLIDFWEKDDWRKTKESEKILNKKK